MTHKALTQTHFTEIITHLTLITMIIRVLNAFEMVFGSWIGAALALDEKVLK